MIRKKNLRYVDILLLVSFVGVAVFGLFVLYSATRVEVLSLEQYFNRQIVWWVVAVVVSLFFLFLPPRVFYAMAPLLYGLSIVLLMMVLVVGRGPAKRWLYIGSFGFQPSEYAKLALIFLTARIMSDKRFNPNRLSSIAFVFLFAMVQMILVVLEPDLGTSVAYPVLTTGMLLYAGLSWQWLLVIASPLLAMVLSFHWLMRLVFVVIFLFFLRKLLRAEFWEKLVIVIVVLGFLFSSPLVWNSLKDYQRQRILSFINPEADPLGAGWHTLQSRIAIGSGMWSGKGYLEGTQKKLAFLPQQHTDFVFSVLGEELGFVGSMFFLLLYSLMLYRMLKLSFRVRNQFSAFVIAGSIVYFVFHLFLNVGMATGMLPVVGIPLPFMSYGGSCLVFALCLVVFAVNAGARWYEY